MTAIDAVRTPLTAGVEVISPVTLNPLMPLIDADTVRGTVDVTTPPADVAAVASAMICAAAASVALAEAMSWLAAASVARNDV